MIAKILIIVVLILAGFLFYVGQMPSDFNISREITIASKPEPIFPYVNKSKKCTEWMPWKDSDPGAVMNYSGPEEGIGATTSWDSAGEMGTGKAEIIDSRPNEIVKTQLTYTKPMAMSQLAEITLKPVENGTLVRWSVTGKNSFTGRLFCLFLNMDKVVGNQFTKGLENLKKIVESKK
jgi:uncharacterized protein YndB with AHSA1/START domain